MPIDRILLVPRWSGHRDSDFYPWLTRALAARGWRGELEVVSLRPPDAPEIAATVTAIRGRLGSKARASHTIVMGHSVGAQAALRALADLPGGVEVAAFLGIAAWWTVDRPWPEIQPWIETPFDWSRTRTTARRRIVLLSTDDPFTADVEGTRRQFEDRLAADVRIHGGASHFNAPEQPAILSAIFELLTQP